MKKIILFSIICALCTQAKSQWQLTGNAGTNTSTNFIGTTDNIAFKIRTNNGTRVTISSAGKVGIGITAPVGKLHVKGNTNVSQLMIDATSTQTNANPLIRLRKSDGTDLMWIHSDDPFNTFIGYYAGSSNSAVGGGLYNTFIGRSAGNYNTTGYSNTASGEEALAFNTSGYQNTACGVNALWLNTTATQNTAIGSFALLTQSFNNGGTPWASGNTAVGFEALYSNQPNAISNGVSNTAVGHSALRANTTGYDNTAIGVSALYSNETGMQNTAAGRQALFYNTTGRDNTATGYKALRNNTTGSYNTAYGNYALQDNNGGGNTATGMYALSSNQGGNFNTANGNFALTNNTTGNENTGLGYSAHGSSGTLTNATAIGARAYVGQSNSMVLGSINGINGGSSNVKVGIGTYAPAYPLDVYGNLLITGNFVNTVTSTDYYGLSGACSNTPYYGYGVAGRGGWIGVYGDASLAGFGSRYGVSAYGAAGEYNYGLTADAEGGLSAYGIFATASGAANFNNWAGFFSGGVFTNASYVTSDRKLKNDIKPLKDAMSIINQLKPSIYTYKTDEYKQMHLSEELQYGLIADEVQQVLPGIVKRAIHPAEYENHDEKNGKKLNDAVEFNALNYTGIIPILIGGIKEHNQIIEELKIKNGKLENEIEIIKSVLSSEQKQKFDEIRNENTGTLEQNSPNPFNTQTEIKFRLPSIFNSAQLIITDANGKQVRSDILKSSSSVIINASELSAGTYSYSLVIDGVNVDSKQMVLTK